MMASSTTALGDFLRSASSSCRMGRAKRNPSYSLPPPCLPHRRQYDIGGARARRLVAGRQDPVDLGKRLQLLSTQVTVAQHLAERGGEFFRRAVFLQEFGNDVLADHEIGQ